MLGVFLDTETNGLNPFRHKILEIAFKIIDVETGETKVAYDSLIAVSEEMWKDSDPESLKVNGFSWNEVKAGKALGKVSEEVFALFMQYNIVRSKAVFICQNPSFDRAFFAQLFTTEQQEAKRFPYHWLDLASMYWAESIVKGILPWTKGFSKDKIAAAYHLPPEAQPHRAMNGVNHLLLCYEAIVGYPGVGQPLVPRACHRKIVQAHFCLRYDLRI